MTCAGVRLAGFISAKVTAMPAEASCQAASHPANPPPTTNTRISMLYELPHWRLKVEPGQFG